jgi:citronellol/citronellal dehydrogenase
VIVAGAGPRGGSGAEVADACAALGATVEQCALELAPQAADDGSTAAAVDAAAVAAQGADVLVVDVAALFGAGGPRALVGALEAAWEATRALAANTLIAQGSGGRVVLIAPAPEAGEHAGAARAGAENLARTLSVEWARHDLRAVAICPGDATDAGEVATLVAYLASPAGDYFSGCVLDLSGERAAG